MSDFRAIAAVSTTLRTLLRDRMEQPVTVTIAPPDVSVDGVGSTRRLNLYLYQFAENASLKNYDHSGSSSEPYGTPPLALELYYLMTAYGSSDVGADSDLEAQSVLGDAMRVLHDFAIVADDLNQILAPAEKVLAPELRHQQEKLKITLRNTALDELSKIWTAMPQANFRRSAAYQVSVIEIESRKPRRMAAPVQRRKLMLSVAQRPEVTKVYRTPASGEAIGDPRVRVLQELTIEGSAFTSPATSVRLGVLAPVTVTPDSDTVIRVTVPDDPLLVAGAQSVEVLTERPADAIVGALDHGTGSATTRLLSSNRALFQLVPSVATVSPASGAATGLLTVTGSRLYAEGKSSFVLVGDAALEIRVPLVGEPWAVPAPASVQVPLDRLKTDLPAPPGGGTVYPVRVVVDGAQSLETGKTFRLMP
jgi:hypothetical protein